MSTTSLDGRDILNCDSSLKISLSCALGAIASCIRPSIETESFYEVELVTVTGHTLVEFKGKPSADSHRYRAIGNSMAVPVMSWIGRRLKAAHAGR